MGPPYEPPYPYGDFTHDSPDGRYHFEWTPFTPAINAWRMAQGHLRSALNGLVDARQLQGFALNGLADDHQMMLGALKELTERVQESVTETGKVVAALDVANRDYATANEASAEQYTALVRVIDGVRGDQGRRAAQADITERNAEAGRDRDIAPLDVPTSPAGRPSPAPGPLPTPAQPSPAPAPTAPTPPRPGPAPSPPAPSGG